MKRKAIEDIYLKVDRIMMGTFLYCTALYYRDLLGYQGLSGLARICKVDIIIYIVSIPSYIIPI